MAREKDRVKRRKADSSDGMLDKFCYSFPIHAFVFFSFICLFPIVRMLYTRGLDDHDRQRHHSRSASPPREKTLVPVIFGVLYFFIFIRILRDVVSLNFTFTFYIYFQFSVDAKGHLYLPIQRITREECSTFLFSFSLYSL